MAFLDSTGLSRLIEKIKEYVTNQISTKTDKAYSNITVDGATLSAGAKEDTLEIVAGTNVDITTDVDNNKITISATGGGGGGTPVTYSISKTDSTITLAGSDGSSSTVTDANTTYTNATTSANGLMSSTDKTKLDNTNVAYGTCSTPAATAAKVVTINGNANWTLKAGSRIFVKFTETNSAQNPTLNVNSTGAKSIWYNTALITTGSLGYAGTANRPMEFVYDGTQYVFAGWSLDSNSDTKNTAGSTDSSSKLFLIGATSQAANPQTYSHNTAYVGTDGCLYSNNKKVSTIEYTTTEPTANLNNGSVWIA